MKKINLLAIAILVSSLMMAACNKNVKNDNSASQAQTAVSDAEKDSQTDVTDENLPDTETDIRDYQSFVSNSGLKAVPFNYDKYDLSEEAREIIRENAEVLNSNKMWSIRIEGYCDNRGTAEYNLSLGQKRANSVRDYYVRLGVQPYRIGTISYGVENPLCDEDTEECWQMNRRAETKVK